MELKQYPGEERGAYLTRCLGLDKVKQVRYRGGTIKCTDTIQQERKELAALYDKAKNKTWTFAPNEFTIDKNFNFTHKSWKGTWCKGGSDVNETLNIIRRYISECQKPYGTRNLSFIHLVVD